MTTAPKTTNVMLEKETVIPTMIAKPVLSVVKEMPRMILFQDLLDLKNIKERKESTSTLTSMGTTAMILTSIKRLPNLIQTGSMILQFKLIILETQLAPKENHVALEKVIAIPILIASKA